MALFGFRGSVERYYGYLTDIFLFEAPSRLQKLPERFQSAYFVCPELFPKASPTKSESSEKPNEDDEDGAYLLNIQALCQKNQKRPTQGPKVRKF